MTEAIQTYSNDALNANVRAFMDEGTGEGQRVLMGRYCRAGGGE